jgi:hypothetical protein
MKNEFHAKFKDENKSLAYSKQSVAAPLVSYDIHMTSLKKKKKNQYRY